MRAKWTSTTSRAMARPSPRLRSRIEFEGALFKGGSNYGESEFFGLVERLPTVRYKRKPGSTFHLFYNLAKFGLGLVLRSAVTSNVWA